MENSLRSKHQTHRPSKTEPRSSSKLVKATGRPTNNFKNILTQKKRLSLHLTKKSNLIKKPSHLPLTLKLAKPKIEAAKPKKSSNLGFDSLEFPTSQSLAQAIPMKINFGSNVEAYANLGVGSHLPDEINRLIKKLTLGFTAKKIESQFKVRYGIFEGAHFFLHAFDESLSLKISNASPYARSLLMEHQKTLTNRLAQHEINLDEIMFTN